MKEKEGPRKGIEKFQLVDAGTLAKRYSVSEKTIRKWGANGFLPVVKLSRRAVRYPLLDCDQVIESRRISAVSEVG